MDIQPGISVLINTLNEAANIADCIRSVQGLADEVVVCDMQSDDDTAAIARSLGARVISIEWAEGKYQRMRYLGVQATTHEWVLALDADERMTDRLRAHLQELARNSSIDVVRFGKLYWYFGGWVRHGIFFSQQPLFFRRTVFLANFQEQTFQAHADWAALNGVRQAVTLPFDYHVLHYAYPSIEKYASKTIGMYARVEAETMHQAGRRFQLHRMILQPIKIFMVSFFLKAGYRDGLRGFIITTLYSVYRFATWANLWLLEELARNESQTPDTQHAR